MATHRHGSRPKPKDHLKAKTAAQILGVTPNAMAKWARDGVVQVTKVGKLNYFSAEEIKRLIWEEHGKVQAEKLVLAVDDAVAIANRQVDKEAWNGRRKD